MNRIAKYLPDTASISYKPINPVIKWPDGMTEIITDGWRTPELKRVINTQIKDTGWTVIAIKGLWYMHKGGKYYFYTDYMQILANRKLVGGEEVPAWKTDVSATILNKYAAAYVKLWANGEIPPPSTGDPWNVYETATHNGANNEELKFYMQKYVKQGYYFGSLLMAALLDIGGGDTTQLGVICKQAIGQWLTTGKPNKCKLLLSCLPSMESVLRRYLLKLFNEG